MVFEKIFDKLRPKKVEEDSGDIEVDPSVLSGEQKIDVRIETLKDFTDTDRIQQLVREGNVVFLKIKDLKDKNVSELKRAVDRLKKTCAAMNGDIAGVEEEFLILTPQFARIYRGKAAA